MTGKKYDTSKRKLDYIFNYVKANKIDIDFNLFKQNKKTFSIGYNRGFSKIPIPGKNIPVELRNFTLYRWQGISTRPITTYSSETPSPSNAYIQVPCYDGEMWIFKYPRYGVPIPSEKSPTEFLPGSTEDQWIEDIWSQYSSFQVIKEFINLLNFPEEIIFNCVPVATYSKNPQNLNQFYRWIKMNNGYKLEYYALIQPQIDDLEVSLNLYICNKAVFHAIQTKKI